jgi:hypothetical protein
MGTVYREIKQATGRHRADVRPSGPAGRDHRQARRARSGGARRGGGLRGCAVQLRQRASDPEGHQPARGGGGNRGTGRSVGVGEIHHRAAAVPLLRRDGGRGEDRRPGPARHHPGQPARPDRRGAAGHGAVQRHGALQHRLWPPRRDRGRGDRRRPRSPRSTAFIKSLPEGYQTVGGRARAEALGRRKAARWASRAPC